MKLKPGSALVRQLDRDYHAEPPTYDEAIARGLDWLKVSDSLAVGTDAATRATAWFTYAQAIRGSEPPTIPSEGDK